MRTRVRAILGLFVALLPFASSAQSREGVYVPAGGSGTPWSLNDNHTLIWGGKPYLPIGLRIDGSPGAVQTAKSAGVSDVIVDLPANGKGWDDTLAALRAADMRYLLRIDSLAPMARGFAIEPQAYRIAGISKPRTISLSLPGATSAFVVLASRRDYSIASSGRVPVVDGRLTYDAKPAGEIEHVLLIYPETSSLEQPDYWEALDAHRDSLLSTLKRHAPGPGLRGVVDPVGRTLGLPGRELRFVPTSPYFRMELRDLLEKRYRIVKTAMQTWAMGPNDLETFDDLARLIPLWQGSRGVGLLLDPTTNKTYTAELRRSAIWSDINEAVSTAGSRRLARFVSAVRGVVNVPVVQDWAGYAAPYETKTPALDGVGMHAYGTGPTSLVETGSRAASTVARWATPGWLPATDVDLGTREGLASQLPAVIDDLGSLGARAFFIRTDAPDVMKAVAAEAQKRAEDTTLANAPLQALFFPENARNPATAERLPGNRWWLPSPVDGNRLDLGSMFYGYRMQGPAGSMTVLWAKQPGRYRLRMVNPKAALFQAMDGHNPDPRLSKGGVDVNITDIPMVITGTEEIPIPEISYAEALFRFEHMMGLAERLMRDITEERIHFKDQVGAFDRNPGGSFPLMMAQVDRLGAKVGDVTVVEAERSLDHNFSEPVNLAGCNAGGALLLRSPIAPEEGGYYASYNIASKSREDQEVWISAAIPPERRGDVTVSINGQILQLIGDPVGVYGDGFGWYKLGVTRLGSDPAKLRIQVNGPASNPIAIDTIVLTPRPFAPAGPEVPDPVVFPALPKK